MSARHGELLGSAIWAQLAHEYLNRSQGLGFYNAQLLGDYLHHQVERVQLTPGDIGYAYQDVEWYPFDGQPYDGLDQLSYDVKRAKRAVVSSQYCDHPVWSIDTNLRFRVWHDSAHVEHRLGFSIDEELRLFAIQARELRTGIAAKSLFGPNDRESLVSALFVESVYQLAAYVHLGEYPEVQRVTDLGPVGKAVRGLLLA